MPVIDINKEKCIGCGMCVNDCVGNYLDLVDGKAAPIKEKGCINCGHCYAICPTGAVSMLGAYEEEEPLDMSEFDSEKLLKAMKSRRSIRKFKSTPIEQKKIDMILEAGRYSPTGSNAQDVSYTILGSKQDEIEKVCVDMFRKSATLATPIYAGLKNMKIDDRFFFKGAPLVVVVSARSAINAGLASAYMELMAESLGLGVLYSGFFVMCAALNPFLKKSLDLPSGHKVQACLVIGYHDKKYKRIPSRKPLNSKTL